MRARTGRPTGLRYGLAYVRKLSRASGRMLLWGLGLDRKGWARRLERLSTTMTIVMAMAMVTPMQAPNTAELLLLPPLDEPAAPSP